MKVSENKSTDIQKIFAIGDIHGHLDRLVRLIKRLPNNPEKDILVFLGDYINRGPDTCGVLDYLLELELTVPRIIFLMGNHERLLLEYARTGDSSLLPLLRFMGVEATLSSYGNYLAHAIKNLSFMPAEHQAFLERLLPFWQFGHYLFVHAGVTPGKCAEECTLDELTEIRDLFIRHEQDDGPVVVFGHTPFETPLVQPKKIGVDTGADSGNMLTAVELPTLHFYHA